MSTLGESDAVRSGYAVLNVESGSTLRALINSRGELLFATFPNADLTRPAPAPVIFPHLADGGGFRTEFILLGPITPAETTLRLSGQDGKPLDVAKLP